jgi:nicotinamidase-related amidase
VKGGLNVDNKTALLILDVQQGLFDREKFNLYQEESILKNIRKLINRAHDEGAMVIYLQNSDEDSGFIKGSTEWEIHPYIQPTEKDYVIEKHTPNAFYKTKLHDLLTREDIKYLVITGLQTESTIDTTCRQAFSLGYHNILAKDAHSTFDALPLTAEQIIAHHHRIMASWFAELIVSDDIEFF